ncbi:hypothetical protein CYMTET_25094, partial [Cymbomonas tetramitiformis]
ELQYHHTINTLKYADRAKEIKTHVRRNAGTVDTHITEYQRIIDNLQEEVRDLNRLLHETQRRQHLPTMVDPSWMVRVAAGTAAQAREEMHLQQLLYEAQEEEAQYGFLLRELREEAGGGTDAEDSSALEAECTSLQSRLAGKTSATQSAEKKLEECVSKGAIFEEERGAGLKGSLHAVGAEEVRSLAQYAKHEQRLALARADILSRDSVIQEQQRVIQDLWRVLHHKDVTPQQAVQILDEANEADPAAAAAAPEEGSWSQTRADAETGRGGQQLERTKVHRITGRAAAARWAWICRREPYCRSFAVTLQEPATGEAPSTEMDRRAGALIQMAEEMVAVPPGLEDTPEPHAGGAHSPGQHGPLSPVCESESGTGRTLYERAHVDSHSTPDGRQTGVGDQLGTPGIRSLGQAWQDTPADTSTQGLEGDPAMRGAAAGLPSVNEDAAAVPGPADGNEDSRCSRGRSEGDQEDSAAGGSGAEARKVGLGEQEAVRLNPGRQGGIRPSPYNIAPHPMPLDPSGARANSRLRKLPKAYDNPRQPVRAKGKSRINARPNRRAERGGNGAPMAKHSADSGYDGTGSEAEDSITGMPGMGTLRVVY